MNYPTFRAEHRGHYITVADKSSAIEKSYIAVISIIESAGGIHSLHEKTYDLAISSAIAFINDKQNNEIADEIEVCFDAMITRMGMDRPTTADNIIQYIIEDIRETADDDWSDSDVIIGFRRWIESQF